MKKVFVILVLIGLFCSQLSFAYTVAEIPNPKNLDGGYVSNPDGVLAIETVNQINQMLSELERKTTAQVAVVVVNSIGEESPKNFATQLFNLWGIGQAKKDNGLLVLMVMDNRRVEFETGYGTESVLTDAICKRIQTSAMVPQFKEGNIDQGLVDGLTMVCNIMQDPKYLADLQEPEEDMFNEYNGSRVVIFVAGLYTIIILIAFFIEKSNKLFKKPASGALSKRVPNSMIGWWIVYFIIPMTFFGYMATHSYGLVSIGITFFGLYSLFIFFLLENRIRTVKYLDSKWVENNPYTNYLNYKKYTQNWFWAAIFFPVPFVFYWIFTFLKLKSIRNTPIKCKKCHETMQKQDEKADDSFLRESQILEENLKSIDYDVWVCPSCHGFEIFKFENSFSKYTDCPACHSKTFELIKDRTLESATEYSTGKGESTYLCKSCGHEKVKYYTISKLSSSSSSGSSSGSSSSDWGGGSSGGGGSGSSW